MSRFIFIGSGGGSFLLVRKTDRTRYPDCQEVPSLFAQGIIRNFIATNPGSRPELSELCGDMGTGLGVGTEAFPREDDRLLDFVGLDLSSSIFSQLVLLREPTHQEPSLEDLDTLPAISPAVLAQI